jgi:ferredoxin
LGKFRVEIDKKTCQGFGACVELCPEFFQLLDSDRKSSFTSEKNKKVKKNDEIVVETLDINELECIREAAEACPFKAIQIVDLETDEKLV